MSGGISSQNVKVFVDEFNLTDSLKSYSVPDTVEVYDDTCFGEGSHTYVPGLDDGSCSLDGLYKVGAGETDAVFEALKGRATDPIITIFMEGSDVGDVGRLVKAKETSYEIETPVGGLVGVTVEFQADGGIEYAKVLHDDETPVTATGNGTAVNNGAATVLGYVAHLHVTTASASDTLDVDIEHSTDNTVWAALDSFTQATAATKERISGTGTVNQYVRAVWTIGGASPSFNFAVGFARKLR
jgi:hypothetical protein